MLTILKVNSGVTMEGTEFSMLVMNAEGGIYDIYIEETTHAQLTELMKQYVPTQEQPQQADTDPDMHLSAPVDPEPQPSITPPQHQVEDETLNLRPPQERLPTESLTSSDMMSKVGFDIDYSSAFDDEEDSDPGEEDNMAEEEALVRPL